MGSSRHADLQGVWGQVFQLPGNGVPDDMQQLLEVIGADPREPERGTEPDMARTGFEAAIGYSKSGMDSLFDDFPAASSIDSRTVYLYSSPHSMMNIELEARVGNRNRRVHEMALSLAVIIIGGVYALNGVLNTQQLFHSLIFGMPLQLWGAFFLILGTARIVTLVVNGFWPLGPTVRWVFSIATLLGVWMPMAVAFYIIGFQQGEFMPGMVLAPLIVISEASCLYSLSALREGRKNGI